MTARSHFNIDDLPDTLTKRYAERIAARINQYWHARGFIADAAAVKCRKMWCVRSKIGPNGYPVKRIPRLDTLALVAQGEVRK